MTVDIGSQYEARRKDLIRRINDETITVSELDSRYLSRTPAL